VISEVEIDEALQLLDCAYSKFNKQT
jgi:hypothetical protein